MITLVTGLPRSGTSMMMRILEAGGIAPLTDNLRAADSDNPNGYYEFEPVKQTRLDASWLEQAEGRAVKLVYLLLRDLPADRPYRVIFMQRALKEVVASQAKMLDRLGRTPAGPTDARTLVSTFAAEVAAAKAWLKAQPAFHVHYVNYNRLLESPRQTLDALRRFVVEPLLDLDAMCAVVDPALYRQRDANTGLSHEDTRARRS